MTLKQICMYNFTSVYARSEKEFKPNEMEIIFIFYPDEKHHDSYNGVC